MPELGVVEVGRPQGPGAVAGTLPLPSAWGVLAEAMRQQRPVLVRYHGHERLLCPHMLGWRDGRAKVLAYQAAGTTSAGALPRAVEQRWRSMFVDELEGPVAVDAAWQSAGNYCADPARAGMDRAELAVPAGLAG